MTTANDIHDHLRQAKLNQPKERDICSKFGCGKHLTLAESLAGDRCINHQCRCKPDATKIIKL